MLCGPLWSQSIFISRFVPGNYLADNQHLVEIQNPSRQAINLEGYLLVTRDYSVRIPQGSRIEAGKSFRIGKARQSDKILNLELSRTLDFLIRFHLNEKEGNYVALFNRDLAVLDAFYFSPSPNVPFLPDRDTCITYQGEKIAYYLPPENREIWAYLSVEEGGGFVQAKKKWGVVTNNQEGRQATNYQDLTARDFDGIMTLKWATAYESGPQKHIVERSIDQEKFVVVGEVESLGESDSEQYYTFYDKEVQNKKVYYYRLRNENEEGKIQYSQIRSVQVEEGQGEFSMEAILVLHGNETELSLRFLSQYSQEITIKLLDDRMAEVAILFNDYVFARRPGLLKVSRSLPAGTYYILASTETKRFSKKIVIE